MFNRARNSRGHIKSSVGRASKSQALIGLSKWITDDESSYDDESDSETSQTSDDIY
jgi:hypothetical protein